MKKYDNLVYTCLFGGGAIRGAAHVGVIKALQELGVQIETIAGSSVGSIVAALYALGYTSDELAEIFLNVNFELFRDISFGFKTKFALSKGEVFLDWIRELIEKKYYGEDYSKGNVKPVKFKDISKNLVIITTKMNEFSCKEFSTFETPDFEIAMAVRISCCMPGLMRAVTVDNDLLVDGDLMKGKPMWYLSKNLKNSQNRILEIRLEGVFTGSDESPIEYVNGMYTCMTFSETDFIKHIYGNRDNFDYLTINTGNVVVVDFNYPKEKREEIVNNGYRQTLEYFNNFLVKKKLYLIDVYSEILDNMRNIQGFMLTGRYNTAKIKISEAFIYLSRVKEIIDNDLYECICEFQKELFTNIKVGLLGYSTCQNRTRVKDKLNYLISDLTQRVTELDKYLAKFYV